LPYENVVGHGEVKLVDDGLCGEVAGQDGLVAALRRVGVAPVDALGTVCVWNKGSVKLGASVEKGGGGR